MTNDRSYHAATFGLLGFEPEINNSAIHILGETEGRLGKRLPQSVREWYERDGAMQILAAHSNDDPPIPVERFEIIEWQSHRLLPFRNENQGVCQWALELDASDDPAVFVNVEPVKQRDWELVTSQFSQYIFSCVWDYRTVLHQAAQVSAQTQELSTSTLSFLTGTFPQEKETHGWPGQTQYRFTTGSGGILIWISEVGADWCIGSSDADGLEEVLRKLWHFNDLGKSFYEISPIGGEVLDKLRAEA
jgi:hypothetical protein